MRSLSLFILMVALLTRTASAQQADSPSLWLVRSQTITAELIKDSADLPAFERALLLAGLAKRWWRDDSEKARSWMVTAIEIVEVIPNKENAEERRARLRTARSLLQIVTPIDQKLSKRLIALLSDRAEQISDGEREANAEGLIKAANVLVDSDPKRAAELGTLALHVGPPTEIQGLIVRLRSREPKLSDELFRQTLVVARQTLDVGLLNSLSHAAFPESRTYGASSKIPTSDHLRAEVLRLYLAYLQSNPISAANQSSVCRSVVSFIAPVLTEFDRLVPEQASNVRQFIQRCQSDSPLTRQRLGDAQGDKPLNTVEDLLKAAADSEDIKVRTVYQYRAAALAKSRNDIEQAIKILDSMSAESREFMGESWLSYRWDWASLAALSYFKAGDIYRMRMVINDVPSNLQPFAKIAFIRQLPATTDKDTDPTLEFLDDARNGLRRSSFSDNEKCGWYFSLLPLTVKYQSAQATDVLREAVSLLNRIENSRDKKGNNDGPSVLVDSLAKNLPASLLEMDEYIVKEAVSSIVSPSVRVKVRLELLAACLERLKNTRRTTASNTN